MRRFAPVLIAVGVLACEGGARREADQLLAAVERFRRAENAEKPARVDAIRAVVCTDVDVCRAREVCLASAEATAQALVLEREVERGLAAMEKGELPKDAPEAKALPAKLEEAERLLKQGHADLGKCEAETSALMRRFRR